MKRIVSILLALMLLAGTALAETRISVNGEGIQYVHADLCTLVLGVTEFDTDALKAQSSVNDKINAIVTALKEGGVKDEDIATNQLSIYARYDYSEEIEKVVGYNASNTICVRTEDVDNAGSIIDAAFLAGANTLESVSFSAQDTEQAELECLKAAVADAKAKADALAEALGMKVTAVSEMSEGYSYSQTVSNALYSRASGKVVEEAAADYTATELHSAMVGVTASVSAVYIAE